MRKLLCIICIISIIFTGCKNELEYFFDFDEVVYYNTTMDFEELYLLERKKIKTADDYIAINYLEDRYETRIDTTTLARLEHIGFTKRVIDNNKYPQIREIFSENASDAWVAAGRMIYHEMIGFTGKMLSREKDLQLQKLLKMSRVENSEIPVCEWIFRDIFVFKKNGKTIGMAKICFHCGHSHFIGSSANTDHFNRLHFSKLSELLK